MCFIELTDLTLDAADTDIVSKILMMLYNIGRYRSRFVAYSVG
jgi:hypothetical protein